MIWPHSSLLLGPILGEVCGTPRNLRSRQPTHGSNRRHDWPYWTVRLVCRGHSDDESRKIIGANEIAAWLGHAVALERSSLCGCGSNRWLEYVECVNDHRSVSSGRQPEPMCAVRQVFDQARAELLLSRSPKVNLSPCCATHLETKLIATEVGVRQPPEVRINDDLARLARKGL